MAGGSQTGLRLNTLFFCSVTSYFSFLSTFYYFKPGLLFPFCSLLFPLCSATSYEIKRSTNISLFYLYKNYSTHVLTVVLLFLNIPNENMFTPT